jgi:hypothetical protein
MIAFFILHLLADGFAGDDLTLGRFCQGLDDPDGVIDLAVDAQHRCPYLGSNRLVNYITCLVELRLVMGRKTD